MVWFCLWGLVGLIWDRKCLGLGDLVRVVRFCLVGLGIVL